MASDPRFSRLGLPRRIWTVSAIHGQADRLRAMHEALWERFVPGDRIVYLGNYTGGSEDSRTIETIDEILCFRRNLLARPGMDPEDFVYLRGVQEEMWQKLLQLQFAPGPFGVLEWMLENGIGQTIVDYGARVEDGLQAAREGILSLTKWTNALRENIRRHPGHEKFGTVLRRAAFTEGLNGCDSLLFVHAGLDASRPLTTQGDSFWWANTGFDRLSEPYKPFARVIRGFDPRHNGVKINGVTMSLDGGCGYGGALVGAGLNSAGDMLEMLEA